MSRLRDGSSTAWSKRMRRAWWVLSLALATAEAAAHADAPPSTQRRDERRVVTFDAQSAEGIDGELEAALGELLGRLRIDLVREGNAPTGRTIARVRVEATDRGAVVVVESARGQVSPVRREVDRDDSRSIFRETLAHVIFGAIEPLANESEPAEREPPAPREPPPRPADVAATRNEGLRTRVSIGARIGPRMVATNRASPDFSGVAIVTLATALRPSAELTAGYVLPARLSNRDVDAQLGMVPLRLAIGLEPIAWKSFSLKTMLRGGMEIIPFPPQSAPHLVHIGG